MNMKVGVSAGALLGLAVLSACSGGDTDGGKAKDISGYTDDVFVSDDTTTGSITLDLVENEIAIGDTAGFHVYVKNANGQPVPNIQVACDSEEGIAILEPLKGFELTDDGGQMSGRIGCERPGSYQMVCRLTVGGNKRDFQGVKCRGDVPAGFTGFPGAAGGGLGGGRQVNDNGDIRVIDVGFIDDGSLSTGDPSPNASVDIRQTADCDGDLTTSDPEPFYDTYVNVKVENNLAEQVRFSYLTYSVRNVDGRGDNFTSGSIGLTRESSSTLDANGDTKSIVVPVFPAGGGGKYVGNPSGSGRQITQIGLRTVTFTLVGETASGQGVKISGQATASFNNFNRCSGN